MLIVTDAMCSMIYYTVCGCEYFFCMLYSAQLHIDMICIVPWYVVCSVYSVYYEKDLLSKMLAGSV